MGKGAKCIEMLQLLRARGLMTREDLAQHLQINVRNLSEYRKEVENAGYSIESETGKYGGYRLATDAYFPVLKLTLKEQKAMQEAQNFINGHTDFLLHQDFMQAMDKIKMQMRKQDNDNIYMKTSNQEIQSDVIEWIQQCEDAIHSRTTMEVQYKGMKDRHARTIHIHPYEILHYQGAYYCLAYSLSAKAFRNYKFSKERMESLCCMNTHFTRDTGFDVKHHIGNLGLMKDDIHEFEILVSGNEAILVAEKQPGIHPQMHWKDDEVLYLKTIMEGKLDVIAFLLSLGSHVKILSPQYLKDEICAIAQDLYKNNRT